MPGRAAPGAATSSRTARARPPTGSRGACSAPTPTRARPRARAAPSRARRDRRGTSALAIGSLVNIFGPEVVVIGGGFGVAAFDLLLEPAREVAVLREALAAGGQQVAIVRARARHGRGHRSARRWSPSRRSSGACACRSRSARRRSGTSTTSRCACSPSCARPTSCSPRTRVTRAACSRATGSRRGSSPTTSTTRPRASRSCCRGSRRASGWRSSRTRACPASPIRARGWSARRSTRASPVTVLPGPSAVETALVASGLVGERYAFVGFLPRRRGGARCAVGELAAWAWPVVAFESPQRLAGVARVARARLRRRERSPCAAS